MKNFLVNTKKSAGKADITKGYIQGRLVLLDKYWYQFREQHDAIIDFADESNGNLSKFYFDEGTYELIESSYSDALGYLYESLARFEIHTEASTSATTSQEPTAFSATSTIKRSS